MELEPYEQRIHRRGIGTTYLPLARGDPGARKVHTSRHVDVGVSETLWDRGDYGVFSPAARYGGEY